MNPVKPLSRSLLVPVLLISALWQQLVGCAAVPSGQRGDAADALARKIELVAKKDAWDATGAVTFGFRDMRVHTWDRQRSFHHVKKDDLEVWLDLWDRKGLASRGGTPLTGEELQTALDDAWAWFCNDTFWLNPLVKFFDEGVVRELVTVEGQPALKVTFGAGGVTPGDTYVFKTDGNGNVLSVRMWVQKPPLSGIQFSLSDWITLDTGARIAAQHEANLPGAAVPLVGVRGASTLAQLMPGADLFADLEKRRQTR